MIIYHPFIYELINTDILKQQVLHNRSTSPRWGLFTKDD